MPSDNAKLPSAAASKSLWPLAIGMPLLGVASWIVYSALFIDHDRPLPAALPGVRKRIRTRAGEVSLYAAPEGDDHSLLLIHSVNAAASSYEVRPLFMFYAGKRPVYAIDLPGFGFSSREDRIYTPRDMVDAIHAVSELIRASHDDLPIDVIALSLSCEFAARAALEQPQLYRSLGLISPTGFDKRLSGEGRAQSTKGSPLAHKLMTVPLWSQALCDFFVSRPSMRFFLAKTWGSWRINEGLLEYDQKTAHQPGARHVVWSFLAGFLFAGDISRIYRALQLPVWSVHGSRGDFVDYRYEAEVRDRPNWTFDSFDTGAFPHFEQLDAVTTSYDRFLETLPGDHPAKRHMR